MEHQKKQNKRPSSLQLYYRQLIDLPTLDWEKEKQLFQAYQNGDALAKEQLIEANLKQVYHMAKIYSNQDDQLFLELIQEGNLGLLMALENFNPSKNVPLSHFAGWYIKKYICQFINKNQLISIPESIYFKLRDIKAYKEAFYQEHEVYPTNDQIAQHFDLSLKQLDTMISYDFVFTSTESIVNDNNQTLSELLVDQQSTFLYEQLIDDLIESVENPIDQRITRAYLGIHQPAQTFQQIGKELGISKQAVYQRYQRALLQIRKNYDQ